MMETLAFNELSAVSNQEQCDKGLGMSNNSVEQRKCRHYDMRICKNLEIYSKFISTETSIENLSFFCFD